MRMWHFLICFEIPSHYPDIVLVSWLDCMKGMQGWYNSKSIDNWLLIAIPCEYTVNYYTFSNSRTQSTFTLVTLYMLQILYIIIHHVAVLCQKYHNIVRNGVI